MAKAFTCDICDATYEGEPQSYHDFHLEFEIEPNEYGRDPRTRAVVLQIWTKTPRHDSGYSRTLCPRCMRKALKLAAIGLKFQGYVPLAPAKYTPKAYQVFGRRAMFFLNWFRKDREKYR